MYRMCLCSTVMKALDLGYVSENWCLFLVLREGFTVYPWLASNKKFCLPLERTTGVHGPSTPKVRALFSLLFWTSAQRRQPS